MPGTKDLRKFSASKARNVVKSHLARGSIWISNRGRNLSRVGPPGDKWSRRKAKRNDLASIGNRGIGKDVEGDARPPSPQGGGGILSSLLNLYHRADTTPTSAPSSRRSSRDVEYTPQSSPECSPRTRNQSHPEQEKHRTFSRILLSHGFLSGFHTRHETSKVSL